jgi:predicted secreted protein
MPRTLAAPIVAGALAVGALAGPAAATPACSNTKLSARSSGKTITLTRVCDTITITLEQSSDGGYAWTVSRKPAASVLKLVSARSASTVTAPVVGAPGKYTAVYRAVGRGTAGLKLIESRSFQAGSTIGTFSITVRVA